MSDPSDLLKPLPEELPGAPAVKARERRQLAWLKGLGRAVRGHVNRAVAAGVLNGLGLIGQAALLAYCLDAAIIGGVPVAELTLPLAGLVGIYLLRAACQYVAEEAGAAAAAGVKARLRRDLLARLFELGPRFTETRHSGGLASLLVEQVDALDGFFAKYLPQRFLAGLVPLAILFAVFPVDWVAGALLLVAGPLIPLFMALVGLGAAAASRRQLRTLTRLSGHFLDRLEGLTTLKLFGQTRRELALVAQVSDEYRARTMSVLKLAFLSSAVLEFFSAVGVAMVALYVGLSLLGLLTIGPAAEVTLASGLFVLLLAPEFFQPLRQLAVHYHDRAAALGAAEALLELMPAAAEPAAPRAAAGPAAAIAAPPPVRFENVHVAFEGGARVALTGLSFEVAAGRAMALVGESGAGKTTVLNLLLGFLRPDRGIVEVGPLRLEAESPETVAAALRRAAAWVGQAPYLFHGTLRDNIRLGRPEADDAAVEAAARAARVMAFADRLPQGLDSLVGARGHGLSGGEAQRVAIARALLKDAPLVLLDEPTANLDRESERQVLDALDVLLRGRTVIAATHSPALIARFDHRLELSEGAVAGGAAPLGAGGGQTLAGE